MRFPNGARGGGGSEKCHGDLGGEYVNGHAVFLTSPPIPVISSHGYYCRLEVGRMASFSDGVCGKGDIQFIKCPACPQETQANALWISVWDTARMPAAMRSYADTCVSCGSTFLFVSGFSVRDVQV